MELELRSFAAEDFAEYASWFADPDLNRSLGPMDEEWLELVLSGGEVPSDETWAVFRDGELVAVIEALAEANNPSLYVIGAVATKPTLRGQGIGTVALQRVLDLHKGRGVIEHVARVSVGNITGRRCATKAGFVPSSPEPDRHGYIELRRRQ